MGYTWYKLQSGASIWSHLIIGPNVKIGVNHAKIDIQVSTTRPKLCIASNWSKILTLAPMSYNWYKFQSGASIRSYLIIGPNVKIGVNQAKIIDI